MGFILFEQLTTIITSFGVGLTIGLFAKSFWNIRSIAPKVLKLEKNQRQANNNSHGDIFLDDNSEKEYKGTDSFKLSNDFKMVLVIRNDLKMGKGKACAQCSHSAISAYKRVQNMPNLMRNWALSGTRKVVVKVDSESELYEIKKNAEKAGLNAVIIHDAGLTQIASGSPTVVAIGPAHSKIIDKITGHLKLY